MNILLKALNNSNYTQKYISSLYNMQRLITENISDKSQKRIFTFITAVTFICFAFQRSKIKQLFHFSACNPVSLKYL